MDKTLQSLQDLFSQLEQTNDVAEQDRLIKNEACKHKESIAELCAENEELKREIKFWKFRSGY
jgi:FtsZ-binding cell division protein ZapB